MFALDADIFGAKDCRVKPDNDIFPSLGPAAQRPKDAVTPLETEVKVLPTKTRAAIDTNSVFL